MIPETIQRMMQHRDCLMKQIKRKQAELDELNTLWMMQRNQINAAWIAHRSEKPSMILCCLCCEVVALDLFKCERCLYCDRCCDCVRQREMK